jgi:hypothetical protein
VPSRLDRLLGDRRVRYEETWTSALDRGALISEITRRFAAMGGDLTCDGRSRLTARTGSFWATAWIGNARWPMRWTVELDDADPSVVTVKVVDALPNRIRPGSQRLYLRAIRRAAAGVRRGLDANDP